MRTVKITTTVNIKLHEMPRNAWLRALKNESGALGQLVVFVQRAIKVDPQHTDKLRFAATSVKFCYGYSDIDLALQVNTFI